MSNCNCPTETTDKLYPAYITCWTQAQYEEYLCAWGCMPQGFLYRLSDGPRRGLWEGSGSAGVLDIFHLDGSSLAAIFTATEQILEDQNDG